MSNVTVHRKTLSQMTDAQVKCAFITNNVHNFGDPVYALDGINYNNVCIQYCVVCGYKVEQKENNNERTIRIPLPFPCSVQAQ